MAVGQNRPQPFFIGGDMVRFKNRIERFVPNLRTK